MKGVFVAPIEYKMTTGGEMSMQAGDLAEGAGEVLRSLAEIQVTNAPTLTAGKSTRSRVSVPGLEFDNHGSGMWTGLFELRG
jgi:hypothetical protein